MNWEQMADWRDKIKPVFSSVAAETNIKMKHDTHYDALNYEFSKVIGNEIYRLDFQPTEKHTISVTKYVDTFMFLPKLFSFMHNVIPMFPCLAKIKHEKIGDISGELEGSELKNSILGYLDNAL